MKRFLQCLTLFMVVLLITPNISYAASGIRNPSYHVKLGDEYYTNNLLNNTVITFPNGKKVQADDGYSFLMIDGVLLPDAVVVIQEDRALVPVRIVSEAIGADVKWNAATKQVTIDKDSVKIVMTIGSKNVAVNGKEMSFDVPSVLINDMTYVPLRFVSESLGVNIGYYNEKPFALFPVIWIETITNQNAISKEEAVETAKTVFMTALNETDKTELGNMEERLKEVVEQLECKGEFSRFWTIGQQGGAFMLVDKYTGDVFSFRGMYGEFWINDRFNLTNFIVS